MALDNKYVTDLRPCDVLFGRGSGPNDHEGNIRFRQLVAERKPEYMATNHRQTKAKIAKEIVDQVFAVNGRFMKKVEASELAALGVPDGTDVWEVVGDDTIMEKAKQALRQNTQKRDETRPKSPKSGRASKSPVRNRAPAVEVDEFEPLPLRTPSGFVPGQAVNQVPMQQPAVGQQWNNPEAYPDLLQSRGAPAQAGAKTMLDSYLQAGGGGVEFIEPNNVSMAHLPQESRRVSLTIEELQKLHSRRHSIEKREVNEMMDSFSKMKTSEMDPKSKAQLNTSSETMGTIEHMQTSTADMSVGTMMGSSTFSLFRGNETMLDGTTASAEEEQDGVGPMREMSMGSIGAPYNASMSLSDMWNSRRKSSASTNVSLGGESPGAFSFQPRPVGLMEEEPESLSLDAMGSSSMNMLKSALADGPMAAPADTKEKTTRDGTQG